MIGSAMEVRRGDFSRIFFSFRTFTVDFESGSETMKAVDLSGQELGDRALKIEAVPPPAPPAAKKAGNKFGTCVFSFLCPWQ